MRIVETSNTLSSIVTIMSWLGPDDYLHVSTLGKYVFQQLFSLKEVIVDGKTVNVHVRGLGGGSQRRTSSGASSARSSSYPIE